MPPNSAACLADLDSDAQGLLAALGQGAGPGYDQMPIAEGRARYRAARAATQSTPPEPVAAVHDRTVEHKDGGVKIPVRLYLPAGASERSLPVLVYYHGGGWVFGDLDSFDQLCRKLCNRAQMLVISVDYRLAPEHPFPAQFDDAWAAFLAAPALAASHGGDPDRIVVAGDSAGATLAAAVAIAGRDSGRIALNACMLLYPLLDIQQAWPSQHEFAEGYLLTRDLLHWFKSQYMGEEADVHDWRLSPLRAGSLENLPPTLVLTASHDPLRDEGEAYAARLSAAGNRVTSFRVNGQIHGFLVMDGVMKVADPVITMLAAYLREATGVLLHS